MAKGGGAWKVAYADFVTAMMALFMVLWISSQDQEVLVATSRYFQQPFTSPMSEGSGVLNRDGDESMNKPSPSSRVAEPRDAAGAGSAREVDLQFLSSLAQDFYRQFQMDANAVDRPIDIEVTSDGLRVTLFDRSKKPLFVDQSAEFTDWGSFVMEGLAWMIDRNGFQVIIEGHTRTGLDLPRPEYSAWELSTDRANATRRALTRYAVAPELIRRVTGYGDTRPVPLEPPASESNQRVAISLSVSPLRARGLPRTAPAPSRIDEAPATPQSQSNALPRPDSPPSQLR
jgi:chemotaxis protein MotB